MYVKAKSVKGERIGAAILDNIFISIISTIIGSIALVIVMIIISEMSYQNSERYIKLTAMLPTILSSLVSALLCFFYYTLLPYFFKGATLGKLILKIRVVSIDYKNASFKQLLLRNIFFIENFILTIVLVILYFTVTDANNSIIGLFGSSILGGILTFIVNIVILIMILSTSDERGLHDMIAKTYVVSKDFDLDQINKANILERRDMDWAIFEDEEEEKKDDLEILNKNKDKKQKNNDDIIEILNSDK